MSSYGEVYYTRVPIMEGPLHVSVVPLCQSTKNLPCCVVNVDILVQMALHVQPWACIVC